MKKYYMLALSALIGTSALAQNSNSTEPAVKPVAVERSEKVSNIKDENVVHFNKDLQDPIFTEDFANGLDGNNETDSAWTTDGLHGEVWAWTDEGPQGQYSSSLPALDSETAGNGFMMFDAGYYNDQQTSFIDLTGHLVSPVIDMSSLNSVLIDFTIYFRYCCFSPIPVTVGVSNDGGANWSDYPAYNYNEFIEQANNYSGTMNVTVDLSEVAANESEVLVRFSYNAEFDAGYSHYFVGLDDVEIYENPHAANLAVLQVMNNDVFELWEIKNYPIQQSANVLAGAVYGNYGSMEMTNAQIVFEIENEMGEIISTTTESLGTVPTNTIDTVYHETNYTIEEIGAYTIYATIEADSVDEVPENTVLTREITVTEDLMSYDDLGNTDVQNGPPDGDGTDFDEFGAGCIYFVENEGSTVNGVEVIFGSNSTVGASAYVQIFEIDPSEGINDGSNDNYPQDLLSEAEYFITDDDLGNPVYIAFEDEVSLSVGESYFVTVTQFAGDDEIWFGATENTDTDNSSYLRQLSGNGNMTWFSRPDENALRLIFNSSVSIDELAVVKESLTISPNPFAQQTMVTYQLDQQSEVSYNVFDMNGRMVKNVNLGEQIAGKQIIEIDGSDLDAGAYYFNLVIGESAITKKLILTK